MFDQQDRSWTSRSSIAESVETEVYFALSTEFSKDPDDPENGGKIALPSVLGPSIEQNGYLSSKAALQNVDALENHYRLVLKLAAQHGQRYNEISSYFWLRLHIGCEKGELSFPWYDSFEEITTVFGWLQSAIDGDIWIDIEQGWEMISIRQKQLIHFRQGGAEQGGEYENLAMPRDSLVSSVNELDRRMQTLIGELSTAIGEDYWTRHRYDLRTDLQSP